MKREILAGYLMLIGITQFIFSMLIAESLYSNYSIKANFISDLGVGNTATMFNASVILLGISLLASSILIFRVKISVFVLITGLGATLIGIFPENTGIPHLISAFIAFLFGGIACLYSSISERNYVWTLLGIVSLFGLGMLICGRFLIGPGTTERLIVYAELTWGISYATGLINESI